VPIYPFTVRVARPAGTPLGDLMSEMRLWLDSKKIAPVEFKSAVNGHEVGFDLRFQDQEQANLFRRAFPSLSQPPSHP
jgi:hypothetical protein